MLAIVWSGAACERADREPPLVVAVDARPRVFDPRLATSNIDGNVVRLAFAGLTTVDTPDARPAPALAERIVRIDDRTVDATLRQGLRFHDGSVLDADDVVCTVQSVQSEALGSPFRADWAEVDVRRQDALTVRFRSDSPDPELELRMELGVVPCEATRAGTAIDANFPAGSGPFLLLGQRDDGTVVLGAFPGWWQGPAAIETTLLRPIADPNTRILGLLGGTVDVLAGGIPPMLLPTLAEDPAVQTLRRPALRYTYLVFQLDRDVFSDVRLRRAAAMAIDRDALVRHRFGGAATLSTGLLPPTHWAFTQMPDVPHDPAGALALVTEARPDVDEEGCRVRGALSSSSSRLYRGVAAVLAEQLQAVGICLEQRSYEWATFFADVKAGDFDVALLQWTSIVDPSLYAWAFHSRNIPSEADRSSGGNRGRWRDTEVDALLDAAERATDPPERAALYAEVQRRANAALPYVNLWHEEYLVSHRSGLAGVELTPSGRLGWLYRVHRTQR